ncbi:MAG: hypothetical protein D6765_06380 [Bacteroidetes bacterium]|nr:MAG: hypothetical protein D6765_06380 [Bacteroidota bacterium]
MDKKNPTFPLTEKATLDRHLWLVAGLILLAALSRLLPHPYNFTPLGGMALFGAAYFSRRWLGLLVPLAALWVSNLLLDNLLYAQYYEGFVWFSNPFVFLSLAAVVALGWLTLRKVTLPRLIGSSLAASTLFFLISNFGVWLQGLLYPKTLAGLAACYAAALPFFQNTLLGDLFYVGVLFGTYAFLRKRVPAFA